MHPEARIPRWVVEPVVGIALLVVWIIGFSAPVVTYIPLGADLTVGTTPYAFLIAVGFAAAVGLARVATIASLTLVGALLVIQLLAWPARFGQTSWAAYCMLLVFAVLIGFHAAGRMKIFAPILLVVFALAIPALVVLPGLSAGRIEGLITGKRWSSIEVGPVLAAYTGAALLLTIGLWYLGLRLNRAHHSTTKEPPLPLPAGIDRAVRFLRPALEPVIAVVFYVLWIIAEAGRTGTAPWPLFPFTLALVSGSIALARWRPRIALTLGAALLVCQLIVVSARFSSTSWPVYAALLLVCLVVSATATGRVRWLSLPLTGGYAAVAAVLMAIPALSDGYGWASWSGQGASDSTVFGSFITVLVVGLILTATAWFVGFGLRARGLQRIADAKLGQTVHELHSAEIDLIVASERDRIAQDVHDIMAHSLSVIIAQADGARFIGPTRPEAITESLERIADSARMSLTEVRMLIESLVADPDGHSNPTLDDIDELITRMRTAGLEITVDRYGEAVILSSTQQMAVFRIVQEGLTNALKHAGDQATARLTLDWRGPGLAITVASQGQPSSHPRNLSDDRPTGKGRGLYGMRERARLAGGWLTAGHDEETPGSYLVTAFVPSTTTEPPANEAGTVTP